MKIAIAVLAVLLTASSGHSQLLQIAPFSCYSLSYGSVLTTQRFDIIKDAYRLSAVTSCKSGDGTLCYQAVFTEGNALRLVEKDCCKDGFPACEKDSEKK